MRLLSIYIATAVVLAASSGCKSEREKAEEAASRPDATLETPEPPQADTLDEFLGKLRTSAANRDIPLMASLMTPNFGYQLDPPLEGEGVFAYWDTNNLWNELTLIVHEDFVENGNFMVAPPEFADPTIPYDAYRAGITKVNGVWKFAYFVRNP